MMMVSTSSGLRDYVVFPLTTYTVDAETNRVVPIERDTPDDVREMIYAGVQGEEILMYCSQCRRCRRCCWRDEEW